MNAPLPQAPGESNVARRGKIASLPLAIRNEINTRLDNGSSGGEILNWLNADKEVREVMKRRWSGHAITDGNLSDWRLGGYADWLRRRDHLELLRELAEHGVKMGETGTGSFADGSAAIIGSRLMLALETASDEEALKMAKTVHRLRAGDRGRAKLDLQRRKLSQRDEMIELERQKYRRETTIQFLTWYQCEEVRRIADEKFDNSEKLELLGKEIFGEDWKTEQEYYDEFRYDI